MADMTLEGVEAVRQLNARAAEWAADMTASQVAPWEGAGLRLSVGVQQAAHAYAVMTGDPDYESDPALLFGMRMALGITLDIDPDDVDEAANVIAQEWYACRSRHPFYNDEGDTAHG